MFDLCKCDFAINASGRVTVDCSPLRVLSDGSTFFSIFSSAFCCTFLSYVLREYFFVHFFQYIFESFFSTLLHEYSFGYFLEYFFE